MSDGEQQSFFRPHAYTASSDRAEGIVRAILKQMNPTVDVGEFNVHTDADSYAAYTYVRRDRIIYRIEVKEVGV